MSTRASKKRKLDQVNMAPSTPKAAAEGSNSIQVNVDQASLFVGPFLRFLVGPSKVEYMIHEKVFTQTSSDRAVGPNFALVNLQDHQPKTFDIFARWIYASCTGTKIFSEALLWGLDGFELMEINKLATVYRIRGLKNAIKTCIFLYAKKSNMAWYEMGFTKAALEPVPRGSDESTKFTVLLRELIDEDMLAPGGSRVSMDQLDILPPHLRNIDIVDLLSRQRKQDKVRSKCYYHFHAGGSPCDDGWGSEHIKAD